MDTLLNGQGGAQVDVISIVLKEASEIKDSFSWRWETV